MVTGIEASSIVRLPEEASGHLPSRGQVAVRGLINGHAFQTVLEPDGFRGHWMHVDQKLRHATGIAVGDDVTVTMTATPDWPEPDVPADLKAALASAPPKMRAIWNDITPMSRWEWVRWVKATTNDSTRRRRVEVAIAKMNGGKRRPCCFDLSACTDPAVSKNGKLRDPTQSKTSGSAADGAAADKRAGLTPLRSGEGKEVSVSCPVMLHTAIDARDCRGLAEFYRELLGLQYRQGDEVATDGRPDDADWIVLLDDNGNRVVTIQKKRDTTPPTWPSEDIPMQMHMDFAVPSVEDLERHRERAEKLGARLLHDRSQDEGEPLYVLADPAGHPFCLLVR